MPANEGKVSYLASKESIRAMRQVSSEAAFRTTSTLQLFFLLHALLCYKGLNTLGIIGHLQLQLRAQIVRFRAS